MPRAARFVVPGLPHHITQRGNHRERIFFRGDDHQQYLRVMAEECAANQVEIWAYCLMTNHVHLIAVPSSEKGFARAIGDAHRRYTYYVNARQGWTGHLFQSRFWSYVMDDGHLIAAARYVECNPVKAGMVALPWAYPWSSALANLEARPDILVRRNVMPGLVEDWRGLILSALDERTERLVEEHSRSGLPLGSPEFVSRLELESGRSFGQKKRGRPFKRQPELLPQQ